MDIDTGDMLAMQLGLGKVETQMENVQNVMEKMDDKVDDIPKKMTPLIENMVNRIVRDHEEKKHKTFDLKTMITVLTLGGTAIGAMILQLIGG